MTDDRTHLFIGSRWTAPSGGNRITVRSASTEEVIGSVPEAAEADVDAAVAAARAAFDDPAGWSSWEPERRAEILERLAEEFEARAEQIQRSISSHNGMPIAIARELESFPPVLFRYYAGLIRTATVRRSPVGVVAAIVPWNVPQSLTATKLAPALAAGCTIVIKPSPETVLDAFLLADAAQAAGVPEGVVSIVPGGRELGAYLVAHPGVDKVAFTGSTVGGRAVAQACWATHQVKVPPAAVRRVLLRATGLLIRTGQVLAPDPERTYYEELTGLTKQQRVARSRKIRSFDEEFSHTFRKRHRLPPRQATPRDDLPTEASFAEL